MVDVAFGTPSRYPANSLYVAPVDSTPLHTKCGGGQSKCVKCMGAEVNRFCVCITLSCQRCDQSQLSILALDLVLIALTVGGTHTYAQAGSVPVQIHSFHSHAQADLSKHAQTTATTTRSLACSRSMCIWHASA